ncbi:hypothetical protein KAJ83_07975 [Marivibrio halodurans]|uniref:Uncharacterized protein n=1 Tax=Marivibrio halodurans TaxID=2039722 RepID=A0A8J7S7E9_9PROT|nr:hypothetical protein [Marivibrio halodurans]MBP5856942.1 hypothetical protein [Marivibrio halodurans]
MSLFLLLLAFFILLNSLATLVETRSRAVLSSVSATFRTERISDISAEILVSTLGETPEPAEVLEEVERLWITAVPITKVEMVTAGDDMILELPVMQVFVGAEPRVREDRIDLINATASALAARLRGYTVIAQMTFFVEDLNDDYTPPAAARREAEGGGDTLVDLDDPGADLLPASAMEGLPLAMARADRMAQALTDAGAPPDGVQVGLREGNPRKLQFRFYVRDADAARVTFSAPPPASSTGDAPQPGPDPGAEDEP